MGQLGQPIYRNAFLLMLTLGSGGIFGFFFWLITARIYSPETIGFSASLLALAGFLGSLSSLGLGTGLIRFLPSASTEKNNQINASLTLVSLTALGVGLVFLGGLELWAPAAIFLRGNWPYAIMFLTFTIGFALIPLIDSSFLASRRGSYVLGRSLLDNGLRIGILVLILTSLGALGIFFSFAVALLFAILVSFFVFLPRLYPGFLAVPSLHLSGMRKIVSYAVGNHVANVLHAVPGGVLPLLILLGLSARSSAHFYITWIMAGMLFSVATSSALSLFVEGSHPGSHFTAEAIRSLRFSLLLLVPGVLFLFFLGPFLLGLYGREYSTEGVGLLRTLALSAFFVAINSTFFSYLRVNKKLGELILLSSVLGVGTVVASYFLLEGFGLLGPGVAFFSIQAATSSYILLRNVGASRRVAEGLMRL